MLPSPTEDAEDVDKDAFQEALGNAYDQCASHDIKVVIGDFNGQKEKKKSLVKQLAPFQSTTKLIKMD
jgi:hypothetical protein